MYSFKKNLALLLCLAMALGMLTACGFIPNDPTSPSTEAACAADPDDPSGAIIHQFLDNWEGDMESHLRHCICGETQESSAHIFEDGICSICAAEVVTFDDGETWLSIYNEYGDTTIEICSDADGNITVSVRNVYSYDDAGNIVSKAVYEFDRLTYEALYALGYDGWFHEKEETIYNEDGTKESIAYDFYTQETRQVFYDSEGNLTKVYRFDNAYDEEGHLIHQKTYENEVLTEENEYSLNSKSQRYVSRRTCYFDDGTKQIQEFNEHGAEVMNTLYNSEGTVIDETVRVFEHDEAGNRKHEQVYTNGSLSEEVEYSIVTVDKFTMTYPSKITYHYENGSKVVFECDENKDMIKETHYNADGSVTKVLDYEYSYDENGSLKYKNTYEDGEKIREEMYAQDEDGWRYMSGETVYNEDGSKTVFVYNAIGEILETTKYGADGNVVESTESD